MDKFREALRDSFSEGYKASYLEDVPPIDSLASEIASRYGPMFTREEVREMLESAYCTPMFSVKEAEEVVDEILSRHTEGCAVAEEEAAKRYGPNWRQNDTPAIKASEIEVLTGEKVPEWAGWIAKDSSGITKVYDVEPYGHADLVWISAHDGPGGGAAFRKRDIIPGPWQDSLHRIIHDDEPETRPAPSDIERRILNLETLSDEVGLIHRDLIALTKRVAAIEKRVLADGHAESCAKTRLFNEAKETGWYNLPRCTCHYDEVREGKRG